MSRSVSVVLCTLIGAIAATGCGVKWNLKQEPSILSQKAYEVGACYELLQDVFVVTSNHECEDRTGYLTPPSKIRIGPSIHDAPPTIADWEEQFMPTNVAFGKIEHSSSMPYTDQYGTRIIGVARHGVHLKFLYINKLCSISWWYGYSCYNSPIAQIQDGEYGGWVVDIADISVWHPQKHVCDRFLRKLECIKGFVGNDKSSQK